VKRAKPCNPTVLRVLGGLGVFGAVCGIAGGIANAMNADAIFQHKFLIPVSVYFLITGAGLFLLRKVAAALFVVPIAIIGAIGIGQVFIQGPPSAILLNLILVAPFAFGPAILVYRNWSCLR